MLASSQLRSQNYKLQLQCRAADKKDVGCENSNSFSVDVRPDIGVTMSKDTVGHGYRVQWGTEQ